jgi:hypothetical protein
MIDVYFRDSLNYTFICFFYMKDTCHDEGKNPQKNKYDVVDDYLDWVSR